MAAKRLSSPPSASATLGQRVQEFLRGPSEPSVLAPTLTRTSTSLSPFTRSESELVLTKTKKVVFLGNSESGKTTIFTQIQRVEHAAAALSLSNAENVRLWVAANIKLALPEQNTKALSISEPDEPNEWRDEMADAMKKAVATSKGTPEYKRLASRSIGSLLQDLDRVLAPDYVPTDKDVLLSLPPTSNIVSASLRKTHVTFQLLDVGGRLHQRRKWTQCMVDAAAVMLCVSVADYDRFVRWRSADNQAVTSLQDSLLIAEELATRLLRSVPIFIVFTKADLLQQKLASAGHGFKTAFADYAGPDDSLQGALEHIKALFVKATRGGDVRFHMCCALETGDVSRVWMDVCSLLSR